MINIMNIFDLYRSCLRIWIKIIDISWSKLWRFCFCRTSWRLRNTLINNDDNLCYDNSHLISLSLREINNYNKRSFSFCFENSCLFFEDSFDNKIDLDRRLIKRSNISWNRCLFRRSNNRRDVRRIFNKRWIFVKAT